MKTYPIEFLFEYKQNSPWSMLTGEERRGLDYLTTEIRFQEQINDALCYMSPRQMITEFKINNRVRQWRLSGPSDWLKDKTDRWRLHSQIRHKFSDLLWLTYETPERHAEALANCFRREVVNHASILSSVLVTNYAGEKYSAAYLVNLAWNARDSDLWQKHRFQISIAQ